MLFPILLLSLVLPSLTYAGADAKSSTQLGLEDSLEDLVEKLLEFRLRDMETKMQGEKEKLELRLEEMEMKMSDEKERQTKEKKELEAMIRQMETRLAAKDKEMDELEKRETGLEASMSRLRMEMEDKESASNFTNNQALTNPSLRDLPIVVISAWRYDEIKSPQTVTFDSFLANYNNAARPGGGDGVLDLDSGVFTCFAPGYYTVSFSAHGDVGSNYGPQYLFLYKNGIQLPESYWGLGSASLTATYVGVTGSRIMILHMNLGDTLELRLEDGDWINRITLNIELTGLGFDFLG